MREVDVLPGKRMVVSDVSQDLSSLLNASTISLTVYLPRKDCKGSWMQQRRPMACDIWTQGSGSWWRLQLMEQQTKLSSGVFPEPVAPLQRTAARYSSTFFAGFGCWSFFMLLSWSLWHPLYVPGPARVTHGYLSRTLVDMATLVTPVRVPDKVIDGKVW